MFQQSWYLFLRLNLFVFLSNYSMLILRLTATFDMTSYPSWMEFTTKIKIPLKSTFIQVLLLRNMLKSFFKILHFIDIFVTYKTESHYVHTFACIADTCASLWARSEYILDTFPCKALLPMQ